MNAFFGHFGESPESVLLEKWLRGEEGCLPYVHLRSLGGRAGVGEAGAAIRETLYSVLAENFAGKPVKLRRAEQAMRLLALAFEEGGLEVQREIRGKIEGSKALKKASGEAGGQRLVSMIQRLERVERCCSRPQMEPAQAYDCLGECLESESKVLQFKRRLAEKYSLGRRGEARFLARENELTAAAFFDDASTRLNTPRAGHREKSENLSGRTHRKTVGRLIDGSFELAATEKNERRLEKNKGFFKV